MTRQDEYDLVEAQRVMLALVGVDVDGLTETLFKFGAFGGDVDLAGVAEMLRAISNEKHGEVDVQKFQIFTKRGHQMATMVLVVQDVDDYYDPAQDARVIRSRICIGAAMCRRNGKPSPGSAWPQELRGWRSGRGYYANSGRAQLWLKRGANQDLKDRVVFSRQHLPQMIAALNAAAEEAR